MHVIAAKAVAFQEALTDEFRTYQKQIIQNAKAFSKAMTDCGFRIVSGGTDNHLMLIDLRNKNIPGRKMAKALTKAGIETNCNSVPNDTAPPFNPSGLRLGTPAITTRGMKEEQAKLIASFISQVADNIDNEDILEKIRKEAEALCEQFPVPDIFV